MRAEKFDKWYRRQSAIWAASRHPEEVAGHKVGDMNRVIKAEAGVTSMVGYLPGDPAVIHIGGCRRAGFIVKAGVAGMTIEIDVGGVWSIKKRRGETIVKGAVIYFDAARRCATADVGSCRRSDPAVFGRAVCASPSDLARVDVRLEAIGEG